MKKVYVDAGHGDPDPGACGNGLQEAVINLQIARVIVHALQDAGIDGRLTRSTAKKLSFAERFRRAKAGKADAYLCIHCNAAADHSAHGCEIWAPRTAAKLEGCLRFAKKLYGYLFRQPAIAHDIRWRGIKLASNGTNQDNVIRGVKDFMPAVLLEVAFISNPTDATHLRDTDFQAAIADAVVLAVKAL